MMTQEEFSAAFKNSPMKRARLSGLKRNAAVLLGNVGTADDVDVLTRALDDPEPRVRLGAAWALGRQAPSAAARVTVEATRGGAVREILSRVHQSE